MLFLQQRRDLNAAHHEPIVDGCFGVAQLHVLMGQVQRGEKSIAMQLEGFDSPPNEFHRTEGRIVVQAISNPIEAGTAPDQFGGDLHGNRCGQ